MPDVRSIKRALDAGADPESAGSAALHNRVGPLWWRAMGAAGAAARAGALAVDLEQDAQTRAAVGDVLVPLALARAVDPLHDAGLRPLVFKGPAVAVHYPTPGLRPMDDIDLLLPRSDHRAAVDALRLAGWERAAHAASVSPRRLDSYESMFVHPDVPQLPLELHWDVAAWHERATRVPARDLWRAGRASTLFGISARCLPPEEDLLALANHAGKPFHNFGRLLWSVDISVVIAAAGPSLDWDRVTWLAERWRCRTVLHVALRHADRLGAEIPSAVLTPPPGARRSATVATMVHPAWPFVVGQEATAYRRRGALADTRARKVVLLIGELAFGRATRELPARLRLR